MNVWHWPQESDWTNAQGWKIQQTSDHGVKKRTRNSLFVNYETRTTYLYRTVGFSRGFKKKWSRDDKDLLPTVCSTAVANSSKVVSLKGLSHGLRILKSLALIFQIRRL